MSNIMRVVRNELKHHLAFSQRTERQIAEVILHHTWSPTAAQYKGISTWQAIRNYHKNVRGWSDIGYHIGIGPDSSVWLLRHIQRSGGHTLGHNAHSIGVVMIGNFDEEDPDANGLGRAAKVIATICQEYTLTEDDVFFHREFANKSCPGTLIDRNKFRSMVAKEMAGEDTAPDVSPWAQEEVDWIQAEHIMNGYPDGTFRGQEPMTREMYAVATKRFRDYLWNLFYR